MPTVGYVMAQAGVNLIDVSYTQAASVALRALSAPTAVPDQLTPSRDEMKKAAR